MLRRRPRPIFAPRRQWRPFARKVGWIVVLGLALLYTVVTIQRILEEDPDAERPAQTETTSHQPD